MFGFDYDNANIFNFTICDLPFTQDVLLLRVHKSCVSEVYKYAMRQSCVESKNVTCMTGRNYEVNK